MPPVHFRRPSTSASSSVASDWDGLTLRRMLQSGARKKFERGFEASLASPSSAALADELGSYPDSRQNAPFFRSRSVLGLSPKHELSSESINEKLALDYVDLECLLQEKMREFNVELPMFRNGRYHSRRERPWERKHESSADSTPAEDPSFAARSSVQEPSCTESSAADDKMKQSVTAKSIDYIKSIREAAFLFRLCQKEIKLQINTHCPERARLVEKTLQFYSIVLDYLIDPLEQNKISMDTLREERCEILCISEKVSAFYL